MALVDEMLAWAAYELKPWQSDAARRLFQKVTLNDGDYNDLLLMLKGSPSPQASMKVDQLSDLLCDCFH